MNSPLKKTWIDSPIEYGFSYLQYKKKCNDLKLLHYKV